MPPSTMAKEELSLVATFDDLARHSAVFHNGCEAEFLQFVVNQQECQKKWMVAENECQRQQQELLKMGEMVAISKRQLQQARQLLDREMTQRRQIEKKCAALETKLHQVKELLFTDGSNFSEETREKTEALFNGDSLLQPTSWGPRGRVRDSEGSMLDDLSFDQSGDDLDSSKIRRCSKRPSLANMKNIAAAKKMRGPAPLPPSSSAGMSQAASSGCLIATTTMRYPMDGPITASAVIEAKSPTGEGTSKAIDVMSHQDPRPSAPPAPLPAPHHSDMADTDDSSTWSIPDEKMPVVVTPRAYPQKPNPAFSAVHRYQTPSASSLCGRTTPATAPGGVANLIRTYNSGGKLNQRGHVFVTKTTVRFEMCGPCGKRMKFGKSVLKCEDCNATCHMACREKVPLPCVPNKHTPAGKGEMLSIADYTPLTSPMVPALVVHCINEIEHRGLSEVGIYRIPGPESEVKALKSRFLKGKGPPTISGIDVHTLCGCLKDFLRSLKDPLITRIRWKDFAKAAENQDPQDAQTDMMQVISDLPPPNRDTLAFLVLHLQKVAECGDCKMPASNLAKVFGPTIVGFSEVDPKPTTMLIEVSKQQMVMERLMALPTDYWSTFVNVDTSFMYTPQTRGSAALNYSESARSLGTPRVASGMFKRSLFQHHGK